MAVVQRHPGSWSETGVTLSWEFLVYSAMTLRGLLDAELLEQANLNQMELNRLIKQGLVVSAKSLYVLVISLTRLMSYVLAWGIFL